MNVILLNGSPRKRNTLAALNEFSVFLEKKGFKCNIINLCEAKIEPCLGCLACFDKGEEFCPHHDDVKHIVAQIDATDGVIFSSPVYAFHISVLLKNLLERISHIFHRPRFFGKAATSIVTQGIYGGNDSIKYLSFVEQMLGFKTVDGKVLMTIEPFTTKQKEKNSRALRKLADSYYEQITRERYPEPSICALTMFRTGRTKINNELNEKYRDYTYYRDKGWFTSDYYYPVKIGFVKKIYGSIVDLFSDQFTSSKQLYTTQNRSKIKS